MEDYVKDAKRASISDDIVGLYDKELHEELLRNTELYNAEQKGVREKAIETAKNMLKDTNDYQLISKYTGLSIEDIKKLEG